MKQELTCSPAALPTQQAGVQVMSAGHLANKWPCASPLPILQAGMCFHYSVPGHQPSKLFCLHTPPGTSEPAPASWATLSSLRASPAHAPSLRGINFDQRGAPPSHRSRATTHRTAHRSRCASPLAQARYDGASRRILRL